MTKCCRFTVALTLAVLLSLATRAFSGGALECTNEPPCPLCTVTTPWVPLSTGFGDGSPSSGSVAANSSGAVPVSSESVGAYGALSVAIDLANGDVRTACAAGGAFPYGQHFTLWHNSRDSRTYPAGAGRNYIYNVQLLEHPAEWSPVDVRIVLANGYRIGFDANLDGTFRGEPGIFSRLSKQPDGSYWLYTNGSADMADDGEVCYKFGPADTTGRARLQSIVDGLKTTTIFYVASGNGVGEVERVREDETGREAVFTYDSVGHLASVTSLDSVLTRFDYYASGDLWHLTSADSSKMLEFQYDSDHNITSVSDGAGGHSVSMAYASSARGCEFHNSQGVVQTISYSTDSNNNVVSASIGAAGEVPTVYEITANKLVKSITAPGSPKKCYTYTADKCCVGEGGGSQ